MSDEEVEWLDQCLIEARREGAEAALRWAAENPIDEGTLGYDMAIQVEAETNNSYVARGMAALFEEQKP